MNIIRFHYILIIVLFFTFCETTFISESQFDELYDSVKHLLKYSHNISKVPLDCSDRPFVKIDIVFKEAIVNGFKYFAVYGNNTFYVEIEGITRDHLPIIHRDTQPKPVDSRFRRQMTGKIPIIEYKFVGPLYLYKIVGENDKYKLIGFNQVWVGCPQPLCLSPGFDGILSYSSMIGGSHHYRHNMNSNLIILFRGNYFWYYNFDRNKAIVPPLTDSAIRMEERWVDRRVYNYNYQRQRRGRGGYQPSTNGYLNDSMVVPTYIDAVVAGLNKHNNCLYFFKNDEFVCYEWFSSLSTPKKIVNEWKSSDERWKSAKIDAAFHIKSLIYFISGELLWCFSLDRTECHSYPMKVTDIHKNFPTNITTAFEQNNTIYIIKDSFYYKISVTRFPLKVNNEDMTSNYLFEDLLGCDESHYIAWGFYSYDNFIDKFAQKMQTKTYQRISSKLSHFNPTFLIISLMLLIISSSLLLTIWYRKPLWMTKIFQTLKSPLS